MNNKKRIVTLAELECAITRIMEDNSSKSYKSGRVVGKNSNRYEKTKQKASKLIGIFGVRT